MRPGWLTACLLGAGAALLVVGSRAGYRPATILKGPFLQRTRPAVRRHQRLGGPKRPRGSRRENPPGNP